MAEEPSSRPEQFTLRLRRYDPESGEAPYWDEHTIELEPHRSVLEGDPPGEAPASTAPSGSAAPAGRRSAAPAVCVSTANRARLPHPPGRAPLLAHDGVIEIEPMGNMPVIKDLIVDMDAVHWKKVQRVTRG